MKTLIVKSGSTFDELIDSQGDFDSWIIKTSNGNLTEYHVLDITKENISSVNEQYESVIITGSHSNVTEQPPWQQNLMRLIEQFLHQQIPVLGICYGHQLLATIFGGEVQFHPNGGEYGITIIEKTEQASNDPIFAHMPSHFYGYVSHSQTVSTLPDSATTLAFSQMEPHQAVRYDKHVWGVQFHPEFSRQITSFYFEKMRHTVKNGVFVNPNSVEFDGRIGKLILPLFLKHVQSMLETS
ncbi:MAG: glutamine amidotransferase [Calditrichia bacterium]